MSGGDILGQRGRGAMTDTEQVNCPGRIKGRAFPEWLEAASVSLYHPEARRSIKKGDPVHQGHQDGGTGPRYP
jgi:hypothetical protein